MDGKIGERSEKVQKFVGFSLEAFLRSWVIGDDERTKSPLTKNRYYLVSTKKGLSSLFTCQQLHIIITKISIFGRSVRISLPLRFSFPLSSIPSEERREEETKAWKSVGRSSLHFSREISLLFRGESNKNCSKVPWEKANEKRPPFLVNCMYMHMNVGIRGAFSFFKRFHTSRHVPYNFLDETKFELKVFEGGEWTAKKRFTRRVPLFSSEFHLLAHLTNFLFSLSVEAW